MTKYLPSIILVGTIVLVIILVVAIITGLYFMGKKLIAYNASLRDQNKES